MIKKAPKTSTTGPALTMADLIGQGWITPPSYLMPAPDGDDFLVSGFERLVLNPYKQYMAGKRVIVFCVSAMHCEVVANGFNAAGIPAATVLGSQNAAERQANIELYQSGELLVLVNCVTLLDEPMPQTDGIIMAVPTHSRAKLYSMVACALRPRLTLREREQGLTPEQRRAAIEASDKPRAMIIDCAYNIMRLGLPESWKAEQ